MECGTGISGETPYPSLLLLLPRCRGRYTFNPAKAELTYFPTRFGRSVSKQTVVE